MNRSFYTSFLLVFTLFCSHLDAQTQTVGLFSHLAGSEDDGYVLFSPQYSDTTYLIDKCGRLVHKWGSAYTPGLDFYLLPDGTLLRSGNYPNPVFDSVAGSVGGIIERFDWDGNLLWHYVISDSMETQNHDICYMPNGNILVAIWEKISVSEAIANGRNPAYLSTSLWSAKITEIQPIGTDSAVIVWQWRVWDHLVQNYDPTKPNYGVVADHPELLNLNYVNPNAGAVTDLDWLHLNAVTYNPALDQVMISFHNLDEIYIIDHSTDSIQAAAHTGGVHNHGGDFLYRWGNPIAYGRGTNNQFFQQHDPIWIPYGKYANQIMVFNNGLGRSSIPIDNSSSIDIIAPPVDTAGNYSITAGQPYGPTNLTWTYQPGTSFYSAYEGSAQPLTNGNTIICNALKGQFFEIDSSSNIVWNYVNPVNNGYPVSQGTVVDSNAVYRCLFYPSSYSGFSGQTISPGVLPIELHPLFSACTLDTPPVSIRENIVSVMPNPATNYITIEADALNTVQLMDITGRMMLNGYYPNGSSATQLDIADLPNGIYILCINGTNYKRIVIRH